MKDIVRYRCIISPKIAEIQSNVKLTLGAAPLKWESVQSLRSIPPSEICITALISNNTLDHYDSGTQFMYVNGKLEKDRACYVHPFHNLLKSKIELRNLYSAPVVVANKTYDKLSKTGIPYGLCPFATHLRDILSVRLLMQDYGLVHACSFSIFGKTVIIIGLPGIGKSTILFKALEKGAQFISDDMIILDRKGYIFPCPGVSSLAYEIGRLKKFCHGINKRKTLKYYWLNCVNKIPFLSRFTELPYIDVENLFLQSKTSIPTVPYFIFVLGKGTKQIERVSSDRSFDMITTTNRYLFSYYSNRLLLEYSLLNSWFNLSSLLDVERGLIKKLTNSSITHLSIAPNPVEHFNQIKDTLQSF